MKLKNIFKRDVLLDAVILPSYDQVHVWVFLQSENPSVVIEGLKGMLFLVILTPMWGLFWKLRVIFCDLPTSAWIFIQQLLVCPARSKHEDGKDRHSGAHDEAHGHCSQAQHRLVRHDHTNILSAAKIKLT